MKTNQLLLFCCFAFLWNCSNTSDDTPPINEEEQEEVVNLSEEIEVYNDDLIQNNIVMIIENGGTTAYLVDKTGDRLFTWNFDRNLGNDLELLDDGRVLGIFKSDNPTINLGGWGGIIQIINPDGSIDWSYELNTSDEILHHDVELLPNGNVIVPVWERIDMVTAQQAGIDTNVDIFIEKIIEVDPETDQIVWQWRSWEHIVQDLDQNAPDFGVVADNPNKININYNGDINNGDWMHANGLDYDPAKDVIYFSVNFYNEVWVIDHSTTTQEASGESGGNYGKGGDLIYRFGNPRTYDNEMGPVLLDRNHYPNFLQDNEPGAGNILVYANGNSIGQSTVYELDIPDVFNLFPNTDNEPGIVWSFTDPELFSDKFSGASRSSNGNTIICEGDYGYWEITIDGEVVWKYNGTSQYWRGYVYNLDDPRLSSLGVSF
ncbi:MAG: hypothetical protein HKO67_13520 [Flavobacteriaceae bacterium]|nr:hypothetical protein [Flavobacteriaceae bacterium]NNL81502.1 hypothetical protein [Flavobacteriaceae bacterium]